MNPFRALDDVVVPRLGRGLARCLDAVTGRHHDCNPRRRLLVGAAVLSVVTAVGAAVYTRERPVRAAPATGEVVRVGAAEGEQVPRYLQRSRAELADISLKSTTETYALVGLDAYVEPTVLAPLFSGVRTEAVYARVPLPGVQTEMAAFPATALAADVPAGFRSVAARKDSAAKEAEWSARKLGGTDARERGLRAVYENTARVDRAEATAYRQLCACVYGLVVRATPVRLRQLAARPGIRVVDAAPEVRHLARTVFLPLQPEQIAVVSPPVDKGLPATPNR